MERRGGPASDGAAVRRALRSVGVDADGIDTHRPRDVLERLLSEVDEFRLDPPAHMLVAPRRKWTRRRLRRRLPSGEAMLTPSPRISSPSTKHVAEMDADPVEDALRLEGAFVAGRHLPLHRQGAFDRRDDGREFDEHPVAHGLEQPPAVRGDDRLSGLAPLAHESSPCRPRPRPSCASSRRRRRRGSRQACGRLSSLNVNLGNGPASLSPPLGENCVIT